MKIRKKRKNNISRYDLTGNIRNILLSKYANKRSEI